MLLFRAVSRAENTDINIHNYFRTSANTLEGKQFFKSKTAIDYFVEQATRMRYKPPYAFIITLEIDDECLGALHVDDQILDGYDAITVSEDQLEDFNNCVNFDLLIRHAI